MMGISSDEPHDLSSYNNKTDKRCCCGWEYILLYTSDADEKYSINVSVDLSITPFMEMEKAII